MKILHVIAISLTLLFALPSVTQVAATAPANKGTGRFQNIAPEEMWRRVRQCALPGYAALPFRLHITGTVDIGLGISPDGDVANYRVLDGKPLLVSSALAAIRQWEFGPNAVQGAVTWSRVRALVRFNADGTTAIDLAHAILPDNFGDPGIPSTEPAARMASAVPRPASAPECKSLPPLVDDSNDARQLLLTAGGRVSIHLIGTPCAAVQHRVSGLILCPLG